MRSIPRRTLGSCGIEVPEVGLGCNRIGENSQTDAEWIALLHRALELGVTLFDTAAQYAGGRSEELIGRAFGNRDDVLMATKVMALHEGERAFFTKESVIAGAEKSLRVLQRDCLDIFQTHGSGDMEEVTTPELLEAMALLKQQGKIRLRGAAVFCPQGGVYAIEHDLFDVLQITYNLISADHALPILPVAEQYGVGLLARMPYQRGILTGKFKPTQTDVKGHRAELQGARLPQDVALTEKLRALGEGRPGGMRGLAMQYVLAEKRLSCTIPGARSIEQLEENIAAAQAAPLTPEELSTIKLLTQR